MSVEAGHYRRVLGHLPTGVVLISALDAQGEPEGMLVNSFVSVSLEPPLVAYLPSIGSKTYARISASDLFCVNVLSSQHEPLCRKIAARDANRWEGVGWRRTPLGAPALESAVAWIEARVESVSTTGDHNLVIGRVESLDVGTGADPLVFHRGSYSTITKAAGRLLRVAT
jgi:flavin reductase (DIM6/NTAB) family NADH-FMN oxidoreductase RutF